MSFHSIHELFVCVVVWGGENRCSVVWWCLGGFRLQYSVSEFVHPWIQVEW